MTVSVLGIDMAKHIFQLHGTDDKGRKVVAKTIKRSSLMREVRALSPGLIAFEAGGGAHFWARLFVAEGFAVKVISPQYVRPFRLGPSKDDAVDAAAVAEAASRASIPQVAIKQPWQQDLQFMHRIRQDLIERRTALCNQYRGFLLECGLTPNQGSTSLLTQVQTVQADDDVSVPPMLRRALARFLAEYHSIEADLELTTAELERAAKDDEACQRLLAIPGVGVLTATAFRATMGKGDFLRNGRQAAAFLGLTPRRVGTGGKTKELGLSKHGDKYLRYLLIHGGRALLSAAKRSPGRAQGRVIRLLEKKHSCVAAVALANRNARIAYQLLKTGENYDAKKHDAA